MPVKVISQYCTHSHSSDAPQMPTGVMQDTHLPDLSHTNAPQTYNYAANFDVNAMQVPGTK